MFVGIIKSVSCSLLITVRHRSAYTVVRAKNAFNGKCRYSRSCSSETLRRIFTKFCTIDYVSDLTPHANTETNPVKGGVAAHAWSCRRQACIFIFFFFLQRVSIACYAKRCISHRKFCPFDRLSVCPSHAGIKPKRLKLRSRGLHCRIAPWL